MYGDNDGDGDDDDRDKDDDNHVIFLKAITDHFPGNKIGWKKKHTHTSKNGRKHKKKVTTLSLNIRTVIKSY